NCSDGTLKWRYDAGGLVRSSPCVSDGVVYIGSDDHYLYAISSSDGTLKWRYQTDNWVSSLPCVSDGVVYVGSWDRYLYAINSSDGTLKWRYQTGDYIWSSPCVSDGVVYVGSFDCYLYAIETYGYTGFKDNKSASYFPEKFLTISPNPFSTRLSISLPFSGAIYSLTGQLIIKLDKGKHSLDASRWREGVYIVKSSKECKRAVKIK
ncbi:MAG: PQQ-binding-like beta-propeller repeat protein, partial [Candidatus Coatesbacteria bacterium]|nr:PQQ-binding-like beta-propeller repeat protein [Candidatus Coatesbacteria bacterium]